MTFCQCTASCCSVVSIDVFGSRQGIRRCVGRDWESHSKACWDVHCGERGCFRVGERHPGMCWDECGSLWVSGWCLPDVSGHVWICWDECGSLWVSECCFPDVPGHVWMCWDECGGLWVSEWPFCGMCRDMCGYVGNRPGLPAQLPPSPPPPPPPKEKKFYF